jgi:hypothetical protein
LNILNPNAPPQEPRQAPVVVGPWPTYGQFKLLPEQQRRTLYGSAKAYRAALETAGFVISESYDHFVKRVTRELDL